jgi:hypothetical protein
MFALALAACSGVATPTSTPAAPSSTASPSPSPVESVAPTETATPIETVGPTDPPTPSAPSKPLPSIDQAELDAFLTSSITLIDLADDDLAVTVSYIDPDSEQSIDLGTYSLGSLDQMTNQVPPGTYRLDFRQPANSATGPSCTIEIGDAEGYAFAAVTDAIAISRTGVKPKDVRELFVSTSSLCVK